MDLLLSRQGNLRHGDRVQGINDTPMVGLDLPSATRILEAARPTVQLAIKHCSQPSKQSKYAVGAVEDASPFDIRQISSGYGTDGSGISSKQGKNTLVPFSRSVQSFARSDSLRSDSSASSTPRKTSSVLSSPLLKKLDVFQGQGSTASMRRTESQENKVRFTIIVDALYCLQCL